MADVSSCNLHQVVFLSSKLLSCSNFPELLWLYSSWFLLSVEVQEFSLNSAGLKIKTCVSVFTKIWSTESTFVCRHPQTIQRYTCKTKLDLMPCLEGKTGPQSSIIKTQDFSPDVLKESFVPFWNPSSRGHFVWKHHSHPGLRFLWKTTREAMCECVCVCVSELVCLLARGVSVHHTLHVCVRCGSTSGMRITQHTESEQLYIVNKECDFEALSAALLI